MNIKITKLPSAETNVKGLIENNKIVSLALIRWFFVLCKCVHPQNRTHNPSLCEKWSELGKKFWKSSKIYCRSWKKLDFLENHITNYPKEWCVEQQSGGCKQLPNEYL